MFKRLIAFAPLSLAFLSATAFAEPLPAVSKPFNPDISVNFLGLLRDGTAYSENRQTSPYNGLSLQEAEIYFSSNVDAYLKTVALFAFAEENGSWKAEPEEIYIETTSLPTVTLRAGKFKLGLGKHNQLHTHAFPFIDAPLFQTAIIGEEGLNSAAGSAAALLPLPWYSEIIVQGFSLSNADLFNDATTTPATTPQTGKTGFLGRYRNLWELGDSTTIEFAVSGMVGKNAFSRNTNAFGSDLTLKWRPTEGGKYHALIWNTEYLGAQRMGRFSAAGDNEQKIGGIASYVQWQFAERWWLQARAEMLGLPHETAQAIRTKQSALIGFFPSEFSGFRFQYDLENDRARPRKDHTATLQYNITIGAHPAHAY